MQGKYLVTFARISTLSRCRAEDPLPYFQAATVTGFAKSETWDNPILRPLFDMWGAIPIQRGHGRMQKGHPGLAGDIHCADSIWVISTPRFEYPHQDDHSLRCSPEKWYHSAVAALRINARILTITFGELDCSSQHSQESV